jgi:hypothetical protein
VAQIRERRPTPVHVEGIPETADEWKYLYQTVGRHRLYDPTKEAIEALHAALKANPKTRPSERAVARECGIKHATMARLFDDLERLGAVQASSNGIPRLTVVWPPK